LDYGNDDVHLHANFGVCLHIISWLKALLLEMFFRSPGVARGGGWI
jgi:hypothetical protein